ncbi:MAG: hypothetical protein UW21_C0010G0004 [Candidatus Woesebacteria bacterium GW2011_GWB1_44_11b]|uniref:Right handed beta helix domain-containing protein n=1 Tax=Candidatus Woesebacteria bacterium GW2011_GWB1_44_11b TaxID=1618580 RepID=A0A0G1GGZ7_9BACT|nr:MAG: hypothetical protein UW21_C0010G0004 [Candidatus Woesebacteria bacterium GW2011_GWB1_44_11b]
MKTISLGIAFAILVFALLAPQPAKAVTTCTFTMNGTMMTLDSDCITDETILVPDSYTLDGAGYTITATDPALGHFTGAVVKNEGATAHVTNLTVKALGLANICDAGDNRLRGIMFEGASGSITHNNVEDINQGLSGCQEGNGIEVRNAPFDGTHPETKTVEITHNTVLKYQKTGIVANGDVEVSITNNYVGSAELPFNIAANSIQLGFGAYGAVNNNEVVGNQWDTLSVPQWAATAILIYLAGDVNVNHNNISGNGTDIGIAAYWSGTVNVMNNTIVRTIDELVDNVDDYGIGVEFYGNSGKSKVVRNTFKGWNEAFLGAGLDKVNTVTP